MLILANDSHFAAQLLGPVIQAHSQKIEAVVISTKTRGRGAPSLRIIRKCSRRYAVYRVMVEIVTRLNALRGRGSIACLAEKAGIPILLVQDANRDARLHQMLPNDLGLAINFDQILKKTFLADFRDGVLNLHASRLPRDKGISPVLWAFARGEVEIWATIYRMDDGLDTGPILEQFALPVVDGDTAFSLYERVCKEGGNRLCQAISAYYRGELAEATPQIGSGEKIAFSWPDRQFDDMLRRNRRCLFSFKDIFRALTS